MELERMNDDFIRLDVEKINGYLCAIESLNIVDCPRVDYSFTYLQKTASLLKSVESHIAGAYPDTLLEYWHINLDKINENQFYDSINTWFFQFCKAEIMRNQLTSLQVGFADLLSQLVYPLDVHRVNMIPPVWYATHWETFLMDSKNGCFLLEFSFDT